MKNSHEMSSHGEGLLFMFTLYVYNLILTAQIKLCSRA